jgi:hypothetical protein
MPSQHQNAFIPFYWKGEDKGNESLANMLTFEHLTYGKTYLRTSSTYKSDPLYPSNAFLN